MFAGALHFDEILGVLHHHVHVHIGCGIFHIAEVAERLTCDNADGNRRNAVLQNLGGNAEAFLDFLKSERKGHEAADNACGTGAAVGFDHVAVDHDSVFTEGCKVGCAAQRAAHQALDFLSAAARALALAFHTLACTLREQAVFSGNPTGAFAGKPVWNLREKRRVADDAGAAHFNQNGTVGARNKARGHFEVAVFVKLSVGTFVSHIRPPNISKFQSRPS